ncbi:ribosomal protein L7/L12 [Comamonas piscis]|uniref:Ribosomal protein L7/L12 n=1 Tax=Comamonas piscis TaxID=1562974 RepID=A0A7G5EFE6_9BURK|nr:ribosomal protein L7/L12 [Comamonas piscis]QMV72721.1 ribosomal protein L7/L12 [Comamonas piscis]WSO35495.1 ribosomal protein L7/L12 [Comamonas piscis]
MSTPIPAHIASLWRNNDKIAAIKRLREESGMGLAEAKHALESQLDGDDGLEPPRDGEAMRTAIEAALARGDKIVAIKLLKDATGIGLKEAKDRIESGDPQQWLVPANTAMPNTNTPAEPAAAAWMAPGHEPGRVRSSGAWTAAFVVVLVLVLAGWYFLRA